MQKRKFIPLTTLLLCSLCLGACSCNKPSNTNIIATVNGVDITAENIYDLSLYNKDVAAYVYGVLERALIESSINVTSAMRATAENEVAAFDNKVKNDALLNGTDYKEDLKSALEAEGVSTLEELKANKIYQLQKQVAKTLFLEEKGSEYSSKFIDTNYLYHIGDITLSISGSSTTATDLYALTLSSSEAEAIHDAILELVEGDPYYDVAIAYSSADSKNNGGEEGIVTLNDADISNELRYALIGYSALIEGKYDVLQENLNLQKDPNDAGTTALNNFYSAGLESIPLSYITGLEGNYETSECYSDTKDSVYTNSKVYYRNVLFNSLLNTKTPKFITLTDEEVTKYNAADRVISSEQFGYNVLTPNTKADGYIASSENQNILVNEENKPYVVYKDDNGLHITTIHMTPFTNGYQKYFSTDVDDEDGTYIYAEYGANQDDRLKEVEAFADRYITRDYGNNTANSQLLDFAVFEYYLAQSSKNGNFKILGEVKSMINQYMNAAREYADLKVAKDMEEYHSTYSNTVWFRRVIVASEVPLLSCLEKDEKGNNKCTYKYGVGFEYYTTDTEDGGNG